MTFLTKKKKTSFLTFSRHISYQINKFSLNTFFDVLQVKLAFSSISIVCILRVRGKQKVSVSLVVKYMLSCLSYLILSYLWHKMLLFVKFISMLRLSPYIYISGLSSLDCCCFGWRIWSIAGWFESSNSCEHNSGSVSTEEISLEWLNTGLILLKNTVRKFFRFSQVTKKCYLVSGLNLHIKWLVERILNGLNFALFDCNV